jgi:hypothetical protein
MRRIQYELATAQTEAWCKLWWETLRARMEVDIRRKIIDEIS